MYSLEHTKYIKAKKKKKFLIILSQISIIFFIIIIWQFLADKKIINSFISSSPVNIYKTIISLYKSNNLFNHIWISIYEVIISFLLGTIIGFIIALIFWWNKFLSKVMEPYLTILNSLPKVALGPIIIIWGGANIKSIIIMALLISTIITIINVTEGFNNVDDNKIKLMQSFNATKKQIFFKLILPNSFNNIISALKINIGMSFIGLLPPVGENLNSNKYCSKYLSHYL